MGLPIPGIHLPGRKKDSKNDKAARVTVESVDGTLRRLAEKDLLLQASSGRVLKFRLIARTEFRGKDGKPIRDSLLHPGDKLTIDANPDDLETAIHVILIKSGGGSDREAASVPVDEARVYEPESSDFGRPHGVTETTDADSTRDSGSSESEGERPKLTKKDEEPDARLERPVAPSKEPAMSDDSTDAIIRDARSAAESFSADLPNFLVQQITTRYAGPRAVDNWRVMDTVTADVASVDGKEDYRNIKVNGKPTDKPEDSGSWSTGEFQVTLEDVLSPRTSAAFTPHGQDRIANRQAWVFDLSVDQPHSHWTIVSESGRRYKPAYRGAIWVDKETRRVLRIEQRAVDTPRDFEFDKEESSIEYGFVNIEGRPYLLPVESVNLACGRGTSSCSRNVITFRNYRKFTTDSNITFK